jgi:hypothetical protein
MSLKEISSGPLAQMNVFEKGTLKEGGEMATAGALREGMGRVQR